MCTIDSAYRLSISLLPSDIRVIGIIVSALVERPYIRILTKSAGGEEEQLRHIPDHLKDLNSVAQDIPREHGGAISDVFVAFTGDMSARWFEAGVLRSGGSSYKCACGCGVRGQAR